MGGFLFACKIFFKLFILCQYLTNDRNDVQLLAKIKQQRPDLTSCLKQAKKTNKKDKAHIKKKNGPQVIKGHDPCKMGRKLSEPYRCLSILT